MRVFSRTTIVILLLALVLGPSAAARQSHQKPKWILTWSDEFNAAAGTLVGWTGAGFEFWAAIIHKLGRRSEFSAGY